MENNKCDMCGGDIIIQPGATCGICDYCGSKVDLNITWQEREDILRKEAIQKNEIKKLNDEKETIEKKINILDNKKNNKKYTFIQTCISVVAIVFGFVEKTSLPESIVNLFMSFSMIAIVISIVFIVKYTNYFAGKKGRVAIISVLQLFTLGIYGAVAGIIQIINFTNFENERVRQKNELQETLRKLENELQEIKKNSKFKI